MQDIIQMVVDNGIGVAYMLAILETDKILRKYNIQQKIVKIIVK